MGSHSVLSKQNQDGMSYPGFCGITVLATLMDFQPISRRGFCCPWVNCQIDMIISGHPVIHWSHTDPFIARQIKLQYTFLHRHPLLECLGAQALHAFFQLLNISSGLSAMIGFVAMLFALNCKVQTLLHQSIPVICTDKSCWHLFCVVPIICFLSSLTVHNIGDCEAVFHVLSTLLLPQAWQLLMFTGNHSILLLGPSTKMWGPMQILFTGCCDFYCWELIDPFWACYLPPWATFFTLCHHFLPQIHALLHRSLPPLTIFSLLCCHLVGFSFFVALCGRVAQENPFWKLEPDWVPWLSIHVSQMSQRKWAPRAM